METTSKVTSRWATDETKPAGGQSVTSAATIKASKDTIRPPAIMLRVGCVLSGSPSCPLTLVDGGQASGGSAQLRA